MTELAIVRGCDLDSLLLHDWEQIQSSNPELENPLFSPTFTTTVAAVRDDVEVAVISEKRETVAFFPFHRDPSCRSRAIPIGDLFSDFHGIICRPGFTCEPLRLIKTCGLASYKFNKLIASQKFFAPFHRFSDLSPQMDLSQGYEAYARERTATGSKLIIDCNRKARRMAREVGPLRFVPNSADPELLRQVLAMKSDQYRRTGAPDILALEWVHKMIRIIHETQTGNFAGMLSLLYAGDRLVAGHFGVRSRTVWHHWLPVYDVAMAKYSPGLIFHLKMAEYAPLAGLRTIDLDKGGGGYKARLMTKAIVVASGSVDRRYSRRLLRQVRNLRAKAKKFNSLVRHTGC